LNARERKRSAATASTRRNSKYSNDTTKKPPPLLETETTRLYGRAARPTHRVGRQTDLRTPRAAEAGLARLDELVPEGWVRDDTAMRLRGMYEFRLSRFSARFDDGDDGAIEKRSADYQRLRRELLEAERGAVVELRRVGLTGYEVMNPILRDLDLEETRLGR